MLPYVVLLCESSHTAGVFVAVSPCDDLMWAASEHLYSAELLASCSVDIALGEHNEALVFGSQA